MEAFLNHISIGNIIKQRLCSKYFHRASMLNIFRVVTRIHGLDIVHLDLSPSNIMLPLYSQHLAKMSESEIKIVDYATARLLNDIGQQLGIDTHLYNVTTITVISPCTSLLFQESMLPENERVKISLSKMEQNLFLKILDLWSIFHVCVGFLNKREVPYFDCSNELLEHLKVKKSSDDKGNPVSAYLIFLLDIFYLKKENIQVLKNYLCNTEYFKEYDTRYLLRLLHSLLSFNINTYKSIEYPEFSQRVLSLDPYIMGGDPRIELDW